MKSYLSIPMKLVLVTLATLSQSSIANSREPVGKSLSYIENLSESQEVVTEELKKQEITLKQLELAETSAGKPFLSYDSSSEVANSKSCDYVGKCAQANGTDKYESVSVDWLAFILTGLGESPIVSASKSVKEVVGYMSCGNTYSSRGGAGENSRDLVSANLKSVVNGFTLALTEANGKKHRLDLDQNLVVVSASSFDEQRNRWYPWNLTAYLKAPFNIKPDGSFDMTMAVSTRSLCSFVGKVEFIGDAADKLPRSKR
ncbi:MAG: hypothetical protein F6K54_22665 [Okeania sp. SIO3B5]|uniref:hypothetical protein n=1 Tax=Okeania sp. SIO3B5 TaxID=2607811 RepID=UPI0013FE5C1E|nr:hypothetical protein [Okeania sp. SIO3B5]NEO55625.1 hypothetical protein [Okeania sp. SIO3B5]